MKKFTIVFALVVMMFSSVFAVIENPPVYLKGTFNNWSTDNPMAQVGDFYVTAFQFTGDTNWEEIKVNEGDAWYGRSSAPDGINTERVTLYSADGTSMYQQLKKDKYYTFKTKDAVPNDDAGTKRDVFIFETDAMPITITNVVDDAQTATTALTITITTSANHTQDTVYVRYSKDDFASSTVIKAVKTADMTYQAVISSLVSGEVVKYYVLTSSTSEDIVLVSPEEYYLAIENNSGANYSFTVPTPTGISLAEAKSITVSQANNSLSMEVYSEKNQKLSLSLVNISGQITVNYETNLLKGNNSIVLPQQVEDGIYVLQIMMGEEMLLMKKIMVQ